MARRFAKVSDEEIEEAFFYPSDLVNTKATISLRAGEETLRVSVYIHHYSPPLRGYSCILLYIQYRPYRDPTYRQPPVGLVAQLVEYCTDIAEVWVQVPFRSGISRPLSLVPAKVALITATIIYTVIYTYIGKR